MNFEIADLGFIEHLLLVLAASLFTTILFRRIRLQAIVAYIVAGAVVGPNILGWIENPREFSFIAEFGVAFLLFSIGLEFSLPKMLSMKRAVFGIGTVQVLTCSVVFALAVYLWGTTLDAAIIIAGALALSSTAIVTRELVNTHQLSTHYSQVSIGVLLFQDLAAVLFLIIVPILGGNTGSSFSSLFAIHLFKGLLFFALLMAVGKWILPHIYREVARANSDEIFVLSTLVIALTAAILAHAAGLSMALGGFVIGMMLSESMFKHQINVDIRPFKDILLGLFFVTVGLNIEIPMLQQYWFRILVFTFGMIVIKTVVVALVVRAMGNTPATSVRIGIVLGQAGEFGLALISLAYINNVVPLDQGSFILLIAIFSMILSPFLIRNNQVVTEKILAIFSRKQQDIPGEYQVTILESDHVVIGGFGRVGQTVAELLELNGLTYIGIDRDSELVNSCRKQGRNVVYGDCTSLELLRSCNLERARLAILTFRSMEVARISIRQIRTRGIQVPIIVRCYERGNFEELISIGANWVIAEMLEASLLISAQVLNLLEVDPHVIEEQLDLIRSQNIERSSNKFSVSD